MADSTRGKCRSRIQRRSARFPANDSKSKQNLDTGIVVVDSVTTPYNGWNVVYKDPNFTAGAIVGYAPVYKGTSMGVKVTIDTAKVGEQAML